jgi:predicted RNase H-like HicB family nuclease
MGGEYNMQMFTFTGIVVKEGSAFSVVCPEQDVASQGITIDEARKMLLEAATIHLEGAFEDNLPYLRPLPASDDPRIHSPESIVDVSHFFLNSRE